MFYAISGKITHIFHNKVVITQSGIGYELICPSTNQLNLEQSITLYTYLHWSTENGPSMFGFHNTTEKELFLLLIDCQGIGPKLGITILENVSIFDCITMISNENAQALSSIKGVGQKKAEQMILNLKNKVHKLLDHNTTLATQTSLGLWTDLQQTLSSLHYSAPEIRQTIHILKDQTVNQPHTLDILLRKALIILAKQ